jgi:lysozyme
MHMSTAARRALIECFEGLRELAYHDCAGILTVGFGHTTAAGQPRVTPGLRVTAGEADVILARDLARIEEGVSASLRRPAAQREFDALVDLAFNVGLGALRSSSLLRDFNRGDKQAAADGFLAWTGCNGRRLPGLLRRREAERAWFLGAAPADLAHRADCPDSLMRRAINRVALVAGH